MCLLLETIKLEDGKLANLDFHQKRFDHARSELFHKDPISLEHEIAIPEEAKSGLFRCRITYAEKIQKIEFLPYRLREIKSLKLVHDDEINYQYKYADRERLNHLFSLRGECDDIIIIKNGKATDSYTGNLLFADGETWFTPRNPLLKGTQRHRLLESDLIVEKTITEKDIHSYKKVGIINAFYSLENMPVIKTKDIHQ